MVPLHKKWQKLHGETQAWLDQFLDKSTNPLHKEALYERLKDSIVEFESILLRMYDTMTRLAIAPYEQEFQHKECILNSIGFKSTCNDDEDLKMTYVISYSTQPFLKH